MAYVKTVYANDNPPAINASNLNKSEQGIYDVSVEVDEIKDSVADLTITDFIYEQGEIDGTTGQYIDNNYAIRTKKFDVTCINSFIVHSSEYYNVAIRGYKSDGTLVNIKSYSEQIDIAKVPDGVVKAGISVKNTQVEITPADSDNVEIQVFYNLQRTFDSLVQNDKDVFKYPFAVELTSGTDLNSLTVEGVYVSTSAVSETLINKPIYSTSGALIRVERKSYSVERIAQYFMHASDDDVYYRTYNSNSNTFTEWKKIAYTTDLWVFFTPKLVFEQGTINGNTGRYEDSDVTIRTTTHNLGRFNVSCENGFTYAIRYFDSVGNMIGYVTFRSNKAYYNPPSGTEKIGICLRSTNNITPADSSNITIYSTNYDVIENDINLQKQIDQITNEYGKITISDELSTKVASVIEYNKNQKFVNLFYLTDTHSNDRNASFAIDTMNAINITKMMNAIIHGGDLISTYNLTYEQYVDAMIKNMGIYKLYGEVLFVKGNHDNNHSTVLGDNATKYQYHMMMQSHLANCVFNENDPCACYYYMDCEHEKVRIIILDSFTVDGDSTTVRFDDEQLSWLYNVALNVENNWTVIVFSHQFTSSLTKACNILNAFAHRGIQYGDYIFSNEITTKFVGVVHGHEHEDSSSTSVGFNIIGVTHAYNPDGGFDILTIDTDVNKLYETRIGYGVDREFAF